MVNQITIGHDIAWMMINHSTVDCHVTFSTLSLADPERLIDTLTH